MDFKNERHSKISYKEFMSKPLIISNDKEIKNTSHLLTNNIEKVNNVLNKSINETMNYINEKIENQKVDLKNTVYKTEELLNNLDNTFDKRISDINEKLFNISKENKEIIEQNKKIKYNLEKNLETLESNIISNLNKQIQLILSKLDEFTVEEIEEPEIEEDD